MKHEMNLNDADKAARTVARLNDGFTVASYNIRKAIGRDGRRNPARILNVIADLAADIVVLQEADFRFKGRMAIFNQADIWDETGLVAVDVSPHSPGLGWHGNMLLLRPPFVMTDVTDILLPGMEPRGAFVADLAVGDGGGGLRVVGAHLGLMPWDRRRQARILADAAHAAPGGEAIVVGDFNAVGAAPSTLALLRAGMAEAACGATFPTRAPVARLDRMFYSRALALRGCGVFDRPDVRLASDHLPIHGRFAPASPLIR